MADTPPEGSLPAGGDAADTPSSRAGGGGEPQAPAGGPDATGDKAPGAAPEDVAAAYAAAPAAPGGATGTSWRARRRTKKARRSKLRRRLTRTGLALVLVIVLIVGGAVGYAVYRLGQIQRITVKGLQKVASSGSHANVEDILMVGSTSRCAVKSQKNFQNFVKECEQGVNGINSDVVMILRLDPNNHRVSLLSIPRDTFVPDARAGGLYNKIDAALADGPSQLVQAIEQDFGIPINHYVVLNFESFANVVDALGGVDMYFPTQVYDNQSGLTQMQTGCVHISGLEALALVRARHMYYHYDRKTKQWLGYDGSGDLGRIERDHLFLKVLAKAVAQRGLGNLATDNSLLGAIAPQLTVDTSFGVREMAHLVLTFHSVNVGTSPQYTVPIINDSQTYMYKGYSYGDIVFPAEPQDQQAIDAFTGSAPPGLTLHPGSITVSVEDGTGSPAAAAATVAAVRALGYKVVATGSETPVGPISETTVRYSGPAHLQQAEKVLSDLSGTVVLGQGPTLGAADVTIVTGTSLAVASAGRVSTATSASSAATTTGSLRNPAGATVSSDDAVLTALVTELAMASAGTSSALPSTDGGALGAPTPATSGIPAYDPRGCPPGAKVIK